MLGCLLEMIGWTIISWLIDVVLWLILWVVLLPVCFVVSTPFILIGALFGEGDYVDKLRDRYTRVYYFWASFLGRTV